MGRKSRQREIEEEAFFGPIVSLGREHDPKGWDEESVKAIHGVDVWAALNAQTELYNAIRQKSWRELNRMRVDDASL